MKEVAREWRKLYIWGLRVKMCRDSRAIITAEEALINMGSPINEEILTDLETHMDKETDKGLCLEGQATNQGYLAMMVTMGPETSQEAEQRTERGLRTSLPSPDALDVNAATAS